MSNNHRGRLPKDVNKPWRDEQKLNELYWGEGLTAKETAKRLGCSKRTALVWMDKLGIPKRNGKRTRGPVHYSIDNQGYERWFTHVGEKSIHVGVHRLVAVAHHDADIGNDIIHHKNGLKWDNRPENLEVYSSHKEHMREHGKEREIIREDTGEIKTWR